MVMDKIGTTQSLFLVGTDAETVFRCDYNNITSLANVPYFKQTTGSSYSLVKQLKHLDNSIFFAFNLARKDQNLFIVDYTRMTLQAVAMNTELGYFDTTSAFVFNKFLIGYNSSINLNSNETSKT